MRDALPGHKRLSFIFSACLAATVLIAAQMALILVRGQAFCFNEGCRTVESLTVISPFLFNAAGLGYFLLLLLLAYCARKWDGAKSLLLLLLLAGMAVEGVLFSYQHFVAKTFCSYCLIILGFICTVNFVAGPRQFLTGLIMAISIFCAFSVLAFDSSVSALAGKNGGLDEGSAAVVGQRGKAGAKHYLFFSKDCSHCRNVISKLSEYPACEINLNPIDENVDILAMVPKEKMRRHAPAINRLFLGALQIGAVPVLYVTGEDKAEIIKGDKRIISYLEGNCTIREETVPGRNRSQDQEIIPMSPMSLPSGEDKEAGGCKVDEECGKEGPKP